MPGIPSFGLGRHCVVAPRKIQCADTGHAPQSGCWINKDYSKETAMNRRNFLITSGIVSLAFPQLSFAQQYPSKPIHLVVPFPAGSATDTVARIIAEPLGRVLGQPMVVENRPGADGVIAVRHIINSPPDGHRLLMATATSITGVTTLSRNPPYDPVGDLTALTQIGNFPFLLVVNSSLPINSIPQ